MDRFPTQPGFVEADWIDDALRQSGVLTNGRIASIDWEPIGTGQVGDSARFHLAYDGTSDGPTTVAGKFPAADETSRTTASMFGLYRKEVEFYRQIAPLLDVRVPQVHFAGLSYDGSEFVLLFEDLGPARGGNQLASCSLDDACEAIKQAAAIHAPSWHNARILDAEWVKPPPDLGERVGAMYPQAQALFRERYANTLEPELMQICEDLAASASLWFGRDAPPQCLVHGDFRLDNMLFDIKNGSEPIAVLDWQTVTIGNAMFDIGYFLGCGIGDDLRRQHEDELLELYCTEMANRGVALSRDKIWHDYIVGALHGVSTAVFSAAFVERTDRGDANFLSMARGACALALEHGSIARLRESS